MKRILIIGSGGAGKSTFSKQLSKILDLPIIHLDVHYWLPSWTKTETNKWINKVDELIAADTWVMDGNFGGTLDRRLKRADTIFYFDFSRMRCLYNAFKRMVIGRYFFKKRSDMAEGCREKFDLEFYRWIWNFNKVHRQEYYKILEEMKKDKEVYIIRSYKEKRQVLEVIKDQTNH